MGDLRNVSGLFCHVFTLAGLLHLADTIRKLIWDNYLQPLNCDPAVHSLKTSPFSEPGLNIYGLQLVDTQHHEPAGRGGCAGCLSYNCPTNDQRDLQFEDLSSPEINV